MSIRSTKYSCLEFIDHKKQAKWEKHNRFSNIFLDWQAQCNAITSITSTNIQSLQLSVNNQVNALLPQGTKDIYYSWFAHELFDMAHRNNWNVYFILEAVYWMVFTPSPVGWLDGLKLALRSESTNRNLILKCIDEMVKRAPGHSVSSGDIRRRQPSAGGSASVEKVMQSLNNLLSLIKFANECNDTKIVLEEFRMGVHKAGPLIATELIHVLTKIGLITNLTHIRNVSLCEDNTTRDRTRKLGINTTNDMDDLMRFLRREFSLPSDVVENSVCEMLRWRSNTGNGGRFQEAIGGWQYIYTFDTDDSLLAFDVEGYQKQAPTPQWDYTPPLDYAGIRWWEDNYKSTYYRQLKEVVPLKRGASKKRKRSS